MVESANSSMNESGDIVAAGTVEICNLIHTVRGVQVMLDSDLAMLYGVETKNLNRAVKRNEERFPEDFRFQLTREEVGYLRCQFGTLRGQARDTTIGRTYLPYAYTEQGVAMLSGVLRSEVAVMASVQIMRTFVEMRRFIAGNAGMLDRIRSVELCQLEYQRNTDERFERVFDYMEAHGQAGLPDQKIFFDGQVYDALELLSGLVRRAESKLALVDNYVDDATLSILAKKAYGVAATIWTHPRTRLQQHDIDAFNEQYPTLELRYTEKFHDRFLIIDGAECYHVGASLKDAGRKCFAIARMENPSAASDALMRAGA